MKRSLTPLFTWLWLIMGPLLFSSACAAPEPNAGPTLIQAEPIDLELPIGFTAEVLPFELDRPTQFLIDGDTLWVAELRGGENDEVGQVWAYDLADPSAEPTLILDQLDKPTGLAVLGQSVFVATRDQIIRLDLDVEFDHHTGVSRDQLRVVVDNLPNNGRSNGTLTPIPSGEILYETSGNRRDADSGKLWAFDPADETVREVASGLKGGYAHAVDADGTIWFTEVADGSLQGVAYPDEVNRLEEGGNYGWPTCYGRELAGTDCDGVIPAVTVFAVGSTPTGIAVSPFAEDQLFVARWVSGDVVQVEISIEDGVAVGQPVRFLTGLENPQHLVVVDEALFVSDYRTGKIYRITQTDG